MPRNGGEISIVRNAPELSISHNSSNFGNSPQRHFIIRIIPDFLHDDNIEKHTFCIEITVLDVWNNNFWIRAKPLFLKYEKYKNNLAVELCEKVLKISIY